MITFILLQGTFARATSRSSDHVMRQLHLRRGSAATTSPHVARWYTTSWSPLRHEQANWALTIGRTSLLHCLLRRTRQNSEFRHLLGIRGRYGCDGLDARVPLGLAPPCLSPVQLSYQGNLALLLCRNSLDNDPWIWEVTRYRHHKPGDMSPLRSWRKCGSGAGGVRNIMLR